MEKVALESSHLFSGELLSLDITALIKSLIYEMHHISVTTLNTNNEEESVYGRVNLLDTGCSRQYLYCLKPQLSLLKDPKMMQNATNIGKLDIVWRSNLGERGRLQTSQLQRMVCHNLSIFTYRLYVRLHDDVSGT